MSPQRFVRAQRRKQNENPKVLPSDGPTDGLTGVSARDACASKNGIYLAMFITYGFDLEVGSFKYKVDYVHGQRWDRTYLSEVEPKAIWEAVTCHKYVLLTSQNENLAEMSPPRRK